MKTTGLYGRKYLEIEERETELKPPGHGEVIVKVHACGICGTDLNFVRQWTGPAMALGHELAGEIVETGAGVEALKSGDRVVVEDCTMCGTCVPCKNGRPDLCRNMFGLEGQSGMGQYLRLKHNSLIKFDGLDYTEACLTEPLSVCLNAVLSSAIPLQGSVVVLGCGPLGLMTARVAKLRGAGFVAITGTNAGSTRGRARSEQAERLGIDRVIDAGKEGWERSIKDEFPAGVDRVIVSAPPESIGDALKIVGYGGIITFFGLHFGGSNTINIDINDLIFRKITLQPFFAEPAVNFNVSIDLLKKGLVPAREIVSHVFDVRDYRSVLKSMVEGTEPIIKAVLLPQAQRGATATGGPSTDRAALGGERRREQGEG
jgi:threonine dehydrogenase-like Zn-dependent dehydrogenase